MIRAMINLAKMVTSCNHSADSLEIYAVKTRTKSVAKNTIDFARVFMYNR